MSSHEVSIIYFGPLIHSPLAIRSFSSRFRFRPPRLTIKTTSFFSLWSDSRSKLLHPCFHRNISWTDRVDCERLLPHRWIPSRLPQPPPRCDAVLGVYLDLRLRLSIFSRNTVFPLCSAVPLVVLALKESKFVPASSFFPSCTHDPLRQHSLFCGSSAP